VKQKTPDELNGCDRHVFDLVCLTIFEPKGDHAIFELHETRVGDGYSVGVAGQVLKDVFRALYGLAYT